MAYVYLLKSLKDNTYYIGSTTNLQRRLKEHALGKSKYTRRILPVKLVGYKEFQTSSEAKWEEKLLKKSAWRRKKWLKELEDSSLSESIDS